MTTTTDKAEEAIIAELERQSEECGAWFSAEVYLGKGIGYDGRIDIAALAEAVLKVAIGQERERCLSIVKAIETRTPSESHLIETIVRRLRGDE